VNKVTDGAAELGARSPDAGDEVGAVGRLTATNVRDALHAVTQGRVFDLDPGRFRGMPLWPGHPAYELVTFRTPAGLRADEDEEYRPNERNVHGAAFITELVIASQHTGAHVDALAHWTRGETDEWYGGNSAQTELSDFGPKRADISKVPPIITRGVLLDVAGSRGVDRLSAGEAVTVDDLKRTLDRQGCELHQGDAVLLRTGLMSVWPDRERVSETDGAGLNLAAARWLVEEGGAVLLASDTSLLEQGPSDDPSVPCPVHLYLLIDRGVLIGEFFYLEELAEDRTYEFTLIVLPLKLRGGTASMVRPIAIV